MPARDSVAVIAHDKKKPELLAFAAEHVGILRQWKLVATGQTGKLLHEQLGLEVEAVAHGPEGGDLVIGARVANNQIAAVLFFRDPLTAQPHEPDVSALMRVCDVHAVPLATNRGTADAVIHTLHRGDDFRSPESTR